MEATGFEGAEARTRSPSTERHSSRYASAAGTLRQLAKSRVPGQRDSRYSPAPVCHEGTTWPVEAIASSVA